MKMSKKGIKMLDLIIEHSGNRTTFHPTLVWDEDNAILIDTGMPGQYGQIISAIGGAGVPNEKLTSVIITHQDLDHIGSLPRILEESTQSTITVYAHEEDKPFIEGDLPLIKTDPKRMSEEKWNAIPESLKTLYANPPKAKVNQTLTDGEILPCCGGIEVIFTPGHTPGHISLYLHEYKTLIAGDAMVSRDGKLFGPVRRNTPDTEIAVESLKKFLKYDIREVICYHGGRSSKNINQQIEELVKMGQAAVLDM
ncbi:MBL fold metallo-hydrolase [Peribacillus sp. SCS-155]|uniref:MBL fold metallo-hydrolase n=1 Tax=Peribacillus sedimenti TaxID=3115297 RepID=UPI00390680DD